MVKSRHQGSLLRWAFASGVLACIFAAGLAWIATHDVLTCDRELRARPEPAGWMEWPALPDLGEYRVEGESVSCVGHGLQCATKDARLTTDRVCPRAGVSLQTWFDTGGIYASSFDLQLRRQASTFVVSGKRAPGHGEEFLGAFEPGDMWPWPTFREADTIFPTLLLGVGLLVVVVAGIRSRRQWAFANHYDNPTLYKSGVRNDAGAVVFRDGSAPVVSSANGTPGPVLVRVREVTSGTYREAPGTHAELVLDGDAATLSDMALLVARSRLVQGVVLGAILLGVALGWEALVALRDIRID